MNKDLIALAIGASAESVFAIKEAQKSGFYVIAFDGNPNAIGLNEANESHVIDIKDPGQIINVLKNRIPSVILPIPIGRYLITSGFLNEYYNLKGPQKIASDICTDKYLFHSKLQANGLRNIESILLPKGEIPKSKENFPVIIKPRYGSGNREVIAILNKEEYDEKFLSKAPFNEDFLIETLVQGKEYGVDGAIIDGKFNLVLLREKKLTPLPYVQSIGYYSVTNEDEEILTKAKTYLEKIVKLLKVKNSLFHADLIFSNNEFTIIEMSLRPSGHYLHNNFTIKATGINVIKEYLNFIQEKPYNFKPVNVKKLLIRFYDFEDCTVKKIPDFHKLNNKNNILDYKCTIQNKYLSNVKDGHSIIDRGYFIIESNSKESLNIEAEKILNNFVFE